MPADRPRARDHAAASPPSLSPSPAPAPARPLAALAASALALALALEVALARPARADVGLAGEPAEAPSAEVEVEGDPADPDDGGVLTGSKLAGRDRLTLPGFVVGGGAFVLDRKGGSSQTFTQLGFRSELAIWQLKVGIDANLNLDDDFNIRKQDWDEPSDWPQFIDFIEWGDPGSFIYARVGRLHDATLGHGTLFGHYQSAIDLDSRKTGVEAELNLDHVGVEVVANNVVDWEVLGARAYLDPLTWIGVPIIRSVRTSAQLVVDRAAPKDLLRDAEGAVLLDSDDNLRFEGDALFAFGVGVEVPIKLGPVALVPYADLNLLSGRGSGLHLGAEARFDLPVWDGIGVFAQAEHRILDNGYLPVYFDAQYEVERFAYPERGSPVTKRTFLDERAVAQNGYMVKAGVALPFIEASVSYESFVETPELDRLILGAEVGGIPYVRARALFTHFGVRSVGDAFRLDDRTTIALQALIDVNSWCYIDVSFERAFRVDTGSGKYDAVDAWNPALLVGWFF